MMVAETILPTTPRTRRPVPTGHGGPGFVFAVAALPGEAEGFRWPSWLSPIAGSWTPRRAGLPHSTKRSR